MHHDFLNWTEIKFSFSFLNQQETEKPLFSTPNRAFGWARARFSALPEAFRQAAADIGPAGGGKQKTGNKKAPPNADDAVN